MYMLDDTPTRDTANTKTGLCTDETAKHIQRVDESEDVAVDEHSDEHVEDDELELEIEEVEDEEDREDEEDEECGGYEEEV